MWKFNYRLQEEAGEGGDQGAPQSEQGGEQAEQTQGSMLDSNQPTEDTGLQDGEYFLIDGVKGSGDKPEWFNADKYKSVAEQAKAQRELEKKFGSFTGAPKDGYKLPDDLDSDDELVKQVVEWGNKNNLNQEGFNDLLTLAMAQGQAAEEISKEQEMQKLGENAGQRIKQIEVFLRDKLGDKYDNVAALIKDADSVMLVESVMNAVKPPKLPIDGGDPIPGAPQWSDIEKLMYEKTEDGQLKRMVDPAHEHKIQELMKAFGGDRTDKEVVSW